MRILVDADACPQTVMDIIWTTAEERKVEALFITSLAHVRRDERWQDFQFLIVDQSPEAVDLAIANRVQTGDLVITQDYGLAALALGRGALALSPSGLIYNNDNIGSLLSWRHISAVERRKGFRVRGHATDLHQQELLRFKDALKKVLSD